MKIFKNSIAGLLVLIMLLAGCSKKDAQTGRFDTAYFSCQPEETVMYIDGEEVSWQEFFYHIVYYVTYIEDTSGEVSDWSAPYYGNVSYQQFVLDGAVEWLAYDKALKKGAAAANCVIDSEDEKEIASQWNLLVESYASEAALLDEMRAYYCTKEIYQSTIRNLLLSEKYFEALYGKNGCQLTDGEVEAYTAFDGYLMAKQIFIAKKAVDADENKQTISPKEYDARLNLAQTIAGQLKNVPEAQWTQKIEVLENQYSAEAGFVTVYGDTLFTSSDVGTEIYDGTLATEIGTVSSVLETEDGFHIMLRLPVDYDAVPLAYSDIDGAEAEQYTLRSLTARAMYEKHLVQLAEIISVKQTNALDVLDFNVLFCTE